MAIQEYINKRKFETVSANCWHCTGLANKGIKRKLDDNTKNPEYKPIKVEFLPTKAKECANAKTEMHLGNCPKCEKQVSTIVSLVNKKTGEDYIEGTTVATEIRTLDLKPDPEVVERMQKKQKTEEGETLMTLAEYQEAKSDIPDSLLI